MCPKTPDAVIHLAAVSREGDCAADPHRAFDINVTGSVNVFASARRRNVKQVVFASSEWVYGDVANDAVQDEAAVIDPARVLNEYAAGKLAGEMALNVAVKRGLQAGTVLRFGIVYGPRCANWSAVEALLSNVRTKDEIVVGSLATARRFIHVRDIASGIAATIGRTGFGLYNLAGSELVTLARLIDLSCAVTGRQPRIVERDAAAASIRNPISTKAYRELGLGARHTHRSGIVELAAYFDRAENPHETQQPSASRDVRRTILSMLYRGQASHLGTSMSMVEILIAVYGACDVDAIAGHRDDRDRIFVSKGHGAACTYAVMHHYGLLDAAAIELLPSQRERAGRPCQSCGPSRRTFHRRARTWIAGSGRRRDRPSQPWL